MNSSTGQGSLFLCPSQADFTPDDISTVVSVLQTIGFISHSIAPADKGNAFFSGDRFLDYIAYMGCSPAIQFENSTTADGSGDNFCHIKIHLFEAAQLLVSKKQSRAPHCPNCSKPVINWQANKTQTQIFCESCNTWSDIADFDWRKMAGYGRFFIEITDIFPREAIPRQSLLDELVRAFDTRWLYFYSCQ